MGEPRELGPGSSGTKPGPEFGAELRAEFGAEPGTKPGVEPVAGPDTRVDAVSSERLGLRLRELRLRSGKSLRALARELGISASAVSQIELGTMRPSVSRLIAYVSALGVPLAAVFDTDDAPAVERRLAIRRSGEVDPILLDGGVTFRRLSPAPTPDVEFFESVYPPGSVSNAHGQFLRHDGYEVGTVTRGELTIELGPLTVPDTAPGAGADAVPGVAPSAGADTETVTLAAGDSITYPCHRPHLIGNRSDSVTAVATWLIVHR
ncbi:XRE family transcriptional regulator [Streptomyces sp. NBC_01498]|uniref:helix-turn-helix domain-containing protein n=1 Tax=Streptomyces sp. NBC_01498 TaxID=2975870 RepID=UPI002E7BD28A|nr:XRE family transcriptional regulator [Streptomyces sp. NBC_01498]WTL28862.1 XRE family transcriptional regulator [Streptomyces sp. NBC_01498]